MGESGTVKTTNVCRFTGNTAPKGLQILNTDSTLLLTCHPGQYNNIQEEGEANVNFTGCPKLCPAGRFGREKNLINKGCSGACEPGHYCPRRIYHL